MGLGQRWQSGIKPDPIMDRLGVLIPTKNCRAYLPRHLESLGRWLDLAAEVVVVDSFSTDGTVEYLRESLRHPRLRFLSHPPGLYESWNYGLGQLGTEFAYIATAGDTITRAGVEHLLGVIGAEACDVVLSQPRFVRADGAEVKGPSWAVADIVRRLGLRAPRRLGVLEFLVFATVHAHSGLLGSSASNLYRTARLQRLPFPTEFGTAGDGAWAARHCAEIAWAATPAVFSTFLRHPTGASAVEKARWAAAPRLDAVFRQGIEESLARGRIDRATLEHVGIAELMRVHALWLDAKDAFDQWRRGRRLWSLNPRAWWVRSRRNRLWRQLTDLQVRALSRLQH
jgi:hypothetical protein